MGPATLHTVDFTVGDSPELFTTRVALSEGYTTTADIPAIIRIAIMPLHAGSRFYGITPDDVHVHAIDGLPVV